VSDDKLWAVEVYRHRERERERECAPERNREEGDDYRWRDEEKRG